jgi:endo-1,4-beta-xylanase
MSGFTVYRTFLEFAVNDKDEHNKANHLKDMLTLFFSHPAVKGVIFWGFWDGQLWEHDASLFTGNNVTVRDFVVN